MLSGLQPGALLITGDLIDAKTQLGRGQQWEEEWQASLSHQCHHINAASITAAGDAFDVVTRLACTISVMAVWGPHFKEACSSAEVQAGAGYYHAGVWAVGEQHSGHQGKP